MTVITDTWRFLVARRLWPAALLLVAAIVAVPVVLAKSPAAAPAPAAAVKADNSSLATEPIVTLASTGDRAQRRHVLGTRKDPFKPQATPTPAPKVGAPSGSTQPSTGTPTTGSTSPGTSTPGTGSAGGGTPATTPTGPGGTTMPSTPTTGAPATPKQRYELSELTVRFGPSDATAAAPRTDVKRLEALPSAEEPVLIYLGVLSDKKTAVFLVDSGVVAQGDGTCAPSRTSCETIHLKEGETEFLDVPGTDATQTLVQYQLDLVKIRHKATTSAKVAKLSYARVSKAGQKIVRARIAGSGPLRVAFDRHDGRLHKLSHKAYKAAVARVAKVARASRNRAEGHS